jgi:hypothetical protein
MTRNKDSTSVYGNAPTFIYKEVYLFMKVIKDSRTNLIQYTECPKIS